MFVSEANLRKTLADVDKTQWASWRADLYQMHQLAVGDFATVKRQCLLLGVSLTPQQWIEQLQIECDIKLESQAQHEAHEMPANVGGKSGGKLAY
jgi:hypothetical protein